MRSSTIICCLLSIAVAAGEKQIKLEDIERDNLASERKTKQPELKGVQPIKGAAPPRTLVPSALQFGFSPMKIQQTYFQPQQQYAFPQNYQFAIPAQQATQLAYPQQAQYANARQYAQYQQYENVPYIVDNQLSHPTRAAPQYYTQQYVYLQPYTAASNNIQMVVDPKGNVKYYMYIPAHLLTGGRPDQNLENILQYNNVGPQIFTQEPDYPQTADGSAQYITTPQLPPQPQIPNTSQVQSAQVQLVQQPAQEVLPKSQYTAKGQPQSLLDSYVPSVLQLQYYKQQQQPQVNAIKSAGLTKPILAKQPLYIPGSASELSYAYRLPTTILSRGIKQ